MKIKGTVDIEYEVNPVDYIGVEGFDPEDPDPMVMFTHDWTEDASGLIETCDDYLIVGAKEEPI